MTLAARRRPTAEAVVVVVAALIGLRLGLLPISDNSAFTHLANGMAIARDHAIPRHDPYTFTALGHPWVVQSWLPVGVVGWFARTWNLHAVVLLDGATCALLAALVAALARTRRWETTAAATAVGLLVGAPFWGPRPLLVGLVCFAVVVLALTRQWHPLWLVPVGWVWVQSHGSFPLGVLWCVAFVVGLYLEKRRDDARRALRASGIFVVGILLGALNPLGPKLLTFPLSALSKREVFSRINEWKPVDLSSRPSAVAVIGLALAAMLLVRRRPSPAALIPLLVFVPVGLLAQRNMGPLGLVVAASVGAALARPREAGADAALLPPNLAGAVAVVGAVVVAGLVGMAIQREAVDLSSYPVGAVSWVETNGRFDRPHRVAAPDYVGNFVELRHGARGEVFFDDRIDMFPVSVTKDYIALVDATPDAPRVLERWSVDTLVWQEGRLTGRLRQVGWTRAYAEPRTKWVVLVRPSP